MADSLFKVGFGLLKKLVDMGDGSHAEKVLAQPPEEHITSPAVSAAAVTPSDVTVLDPATKALYIGGAGDLSVILLDDEADVTFVGLAAGQLLPVRATKVMAATTATSIVALY